MELSSYFYCLISLSFYYYLLLYLFLDAIATGKIPPIHEIDEGRTEVDIVKERIT